MRTRSSSNLLVESSPNLTSSNPKRRNRRCSKQPFILEESLVDTMADQRTMAELLRAPTEGYAEAIVGQPVGGSKKTPRVLFSLGRILFPNSLMNSSPSRTKNLRNEISNFQQQFDESFHEAWDQYKDLFRAYLHHGFTELHQLNTFYNALNPADQDSLNSAAGGNLLERLSHRRWQHFLELRDNIQGYVAAAAANYHQGLGSLPSNTIANPNGELKAITTQSGIVFYGYFVPIPPSFINLEEDECVQETLTDQDLAEYTIKAPPPLVQKPKPLSQRNFVVHQRDPLHPNIPYPLRMLKQKQQEKDEVQIHKFWQMFKQLNINITLADALILIPKYHKMLKALLFNKEKLLELANTPLNEITQRELKCKALADLGASINLMPLSVWKKLVPLILGRPFLRTARALIDVHGEEMILCDGDVRLTLYMRHDTSSYSNQPKKSINIINIYDDLSEDFLKDFFATNHQSGNPIFLSHPNLTSPKVKDDVFDPEGGNVLIEKLLDLDSTKDLHPPHNVNPLSGITTSFSSPNHLLEEFVDELALITFPSRNDDLPFDIEFDLKEIEYLLNHDPIKEMDSILKDLIDQSNLVDLNDNLADTIHEMFTEEHALDYSSPSLYDEYDDDLFEVKSDTEYVYNDPFDSKGEKIKEYKLLIDELDLPSDFFPSFKYDSFLFEDFSKVDDLPSTNNEDKKLATSHAFLILEDSDPPLYELPFFEEVLGAETLLSFSFKNEEKVFKPRILTSKGVHSSLIPELSHRGYKIFKIIKILKSPMEIFLFSHGEDIRILDVPCPHFYPP
nr:hypothetical protein [Tanacetum cinerariifolium]